MIVNKYLGTILRIKNPQHKNWNTKIMQWNKLKTFYYVAKMGSFTKAADYLHTSQSSISKHMSDLEHGLKTELFHRLPRGLYLTEAGEVLQKTVSKAFTDLETVGTLIREQGTEPQGKLRVATTTLFAWVWIMDYIPQFSKQYPKIQLTITGCDTIPDLIAQEADVAICPYIPNQPDLVQEYLRTWQLKLYASQDYLDRFGTPKTPEDLDNHQLLAFGDHARQPFPTINWLLSLGTKGGHQRKPYLQINSTQALIQAAEAGMGISTFSPEPVKRQKADLINILPDEKGPTVDAYYIYPQQLKHSKRVIALGEFIKSVI